MLSKEEQVAKIKQVMSQKDSCPDWRFNFGKYRGELLSRVLNFDKQYLLWLYHSDAKLPKNVIAFLATLN